MKSLIFSQDLEVYGILIGQYSDHMTKKKKRFHETLGLRRLENWSFGYSYSIETPKSHFLWDFWRFGLKRLLRRLLIGSIFGFHLWNHAHNSANTLSILTKLLLKIDIYVFYLIIQRFIDNYFILIKYLRFSGQKIHAHVKLLIFTCTCHAPPLIYLYYRKYEQTPLCACAQPHLVRFSLEIMTFEDRDRNFSLPAVPVSSTSNFLCQITQQLLN